MKSDVSKSRNKCDYLPKTSWGLIRVVLSEDEDSVVVAHLLVEGLVDRLEEGEHGHQA